MNMSLLLQILALMSSLAVLGILIWINFIKPARRKIEIENPVKIELRRESSTGDVNIFEAKSHSQITLELRINNLTSFTLNEIICGFEGNLKNKPVPIGVKKIFIKEATKTEDSFRTNDNHYLSIRNNYHIRETQIRNRGDNSPMGYLIETKEPGDYPLIFILITTEGTAEIKSDIIFRVT